MFLLLFPFEAFVLFEQPDRIINDMVKSEKQCATNLFICFTPYFNKCLYNPNEFYVIDILYHI